MSVTIDTVRAAARSISDTVIRTPVLRLPHEGELFANAENLQLTNSFKVRGALNMLLNLSDEQRRRGVVAHSSGNHAQGVAFAALLLGVPATIVIPEGAPAVKVRRTVALGARVVRCENSSTERERVAARLVEEHGYTLVPPFDNPLIVSGQGTVGLEIAQDLPGVSNVLVPIGGGGLSAGVATALKSLLPQVRVIGVEPALAADAAASLRSGQPVEWEAKQVSRTVADGVRTQRLGDLNFELLAKHLDGVVTVSDEDILRATAWYFEKARLVVEPTGALTLAGYRELTQGAEDVRLASGPTVLVISGGNIEPALLNTLLATSEAAAS